MHTNGTAAQCLALPPPHTFITGPRIFSIHILSNFNVSDPLAASLFPSSSHRNITPHLRRAPIRSRTALSLHSTMIAPARPALLRAALSSARSLSRPRSAAVTAARHFAAKSDGPSPIPEVKPGAPGEIPSILDQATGLERAEIDHPDLFKHNEVLRGPFGTATNPVKIQSNYESRIVGCTGKSTPADHDLVWLSVEKGEPSTCRECGQVFELDPL